MKYELLFSDRAAVIVTTKNEHNTFPHIWNDVGEELDKSSLA